MRFPWAGGAGDFELKPQKLHRLFTTGIADAVQVLFPRSCQLFSPVVRRAMHGCLQASCAVVTAAGTDAGVHKLVAAGLRELNVKRPLIGVSCALRNLPTASFGSPPVHACACPQALHRFAKFAGRSSSK